MDMAFDTILQTTVSASDADPNDRYRYSCLCCKEPVYVAASEQKVQVVHFRHHKGNNGKGDCENYIPQPGQSIRTPKSQGNNVSFYYDDAKKLFYLSLRFDEDEIQEHQSKNENLELRSSYISQPFYSCPIDFTHFSPSMTSYFPLKVYSDSYYVTFSTEEKRHGHKLFNGGKPIFLKVLGDVEPSFIAKRIQSYCLYTDTLYFMVLAEGEAPTPFIKLVEVIKQFHFNTMGRRFTGILLRFQRKNDDIEYYLNELGYRLETSETLCILWPPMARADDSFLSDTNTVYISSSFQLRPKGNTNALSHEIEQLSEGISCITRTGDILIHWKNADAIINPFHEQRSTIQLLPIVEKSETHFEIPDGMSYWILHRCGTHMLCSGAEIILSTGDKIVGYQQTYPLKQLVMPSESPLEGQALLENIQRNYKVSVPYDANELIGLKLSQVAIGYLSKCRETGFINRKVKELIESGVI